MRAIIITAGCAAALTLAACGSSPVTARGEMQVEESCLSAVSDYPDISDGTQVVVTDSSGKVLAQSALRAPETLSKGVSGFGAVCGYPFTVSVPSGQARYGITIGHNRGTVWFTPAEMKKGPALDLTPGTAF